MQRLAAGGAYRTAEEVRRRPAALFPSLLFYPRFLAIALRAARRARKGLYDGADWAADSLRVLRALEAVGVDVTVEGLDTLRDLRGPCVFVGNHMSTLETMVLPGIIQPFAEVTFVVKEALVRYPFFRHVMGSRDPVLVGRVNPREDLREVLEKGSAKLAAGSSMIVFPQTTRSETMDPAAFNSIGVKLARRAKVPAVPFALRTDAWGMGSLVKEFGAIDPSKRVFFAFGEPMAVTGTGRAEHERIVEYIAGRLEQWRRRA